MAINKVIYGGNTLIDLTGDSVTKDKLLAGYTAHDKSGEVIEGTCLFDVDSTDATATAAEILNGQTAYARGNKVSGTMKNNGAVSEEITDKDSVYTIPIGYHDGSGTVQLDATERAKLIPGNIKKGVNVLGVEGDCEPSSDVTAQAKTATPSTVKQTILIQGLYRTHGRWYNSYRNVVQQLSSRTVLLRYPSGFGWKPD